MTVRNVRKRWSCPECRQIHTCSIDTLSRAYFVEKIVEKFKKQAEQPKHGPKSQFGTCEKHNRDLEVRKFLSNVERTLSEEMY